MTVKELKKRDKTRKHGQIKDIDEIKNCKEPYTLNTLCQMR
jgi:hypothetical protein